MLEIKKVVENETATVKLSGRLDTVTSPELEAELKDVTPSIKSLTFDIENLEYISSAGLRVFLATQKIMAKQGEMKVVHVNESIMDIFEVTGFSEILTIE